MSNHVVYILAATGGFYKIGQSKALKLRVKTFQSLPWEVKLIHQIKSNEPVALERLLHAKYRALRIKGEWFRLSDSDIFELLSIEQWDNPPAPSVHGGGGKSLDSQFHMRCTPEEMSRWKLLAQQHGLALSELVRKVANEGINRHAKGESCGPNPRKPVLPANVAPPSVEPPSRQQRKPKKPKTIEAPDPSQWCSRCQRMGVAACPACLAK
jgi:hypothetical protein